MHENCTHNKLSSCILLQNENSHSLQNAKSSLKPNGKRGELWVESRGVDTDDQDNGRLIQQGEASGSELVCPLNAETGSISDGTPKSALSAKKQGHL